MRRPSRKALIREIERAIDRSPARSESGRYVVYVPGEVVIGTYGERAAANAAAVAWSSSVEGVVVVDRGSASPGTARSRGAAR